MGFASQKSPSTGLTYLSNSPANRPERLVFCIPGLGTPGSDYEPLLQLLANKYPRNLYIAVDLPGSGGSPSSLCPDLTFAEIVSLLEGLRDEVADPSDGVVLIGHSMGCRLALEAFSQSPDAVSAVVLLDGSWHGPNPPAVDTQALPPRDVQMQHILKTIETMFGPSTPDAFKEEHRKMLEHADLDYLTQLTIENRRWDANRMVQALQQLRTVNDSHHPVRLLLIQATDGAGGPRRQLKAGEETAWMKTARENTAGVGSCLLVEGSGHWPHVDKANEVAQAISALIS